MPATHSASATICRETVPCSAFAASALKDGSPDPGSPQNLEHFSAVNHESSSLNRVTTESFASAID